VALKLRNFIAWNALALSWIVTTSHPVQAQALQPQRPGVDTPFSTISKDKLKQLKDQNPDITAEFSTESEAQSGKDIGNALDQLSSEEREKAQEILKGRAGTLSDSPGASDLSNLKSAKGGKDNRKRNSREDTDEVYFAPPSSIERIYEGKFPNAVMRNLKQFGYDLFFSRAPETFTPLLDVPTNPDYIVGPRDSFTVNIWGALNLSQKVTVRADGTITLPRIGTLKVWGLTAKQLEQTVQKRLSEYFSGVRSSISFDRIRMIDVFIVGDVRRPGSYSIPSTATSINALFHAGGAAKTGSLRDIRLLRGNKEIAKIDLYDFLVEGANTQIQLQSQDVLLVPVIGAVAGIAGHVKRPAIYEIEKDTTLFDIIQLSGGLSFTGYAGRISLERVEENKRRITRDFEIPADFKSLKREQTLQGDLGFKVQDGDLVQIFPVLPDLEKTVFLRGFVKRPGPYEFKDGMKLRDLLKNFEDVQADPYLEFLQIARTVPPKNTIKSIFPNLGRLFEGDESANVALEAGDEIIVFSKDELQLKEKISIEGKVNKPGQYFYFEGMTLRDLVFMAGNLTEDAYQANAEIARYDVEANELKFRRIQVDLKQAISNPDSDMNPKLQPKDRVLIQGLPNWELENFIQLLGEVKFPGNYSFSHKERLSSVLERAGGFTDRAFLKGSIFTRKSVKAIQEKNLKEQIQRLQEAVLQESLKGTQVSGEDARSMEEAIVARRSLLKSLESSEVTGRMVIEIGWLKEFRGSKFDIALEPGDVLSIPPIPSVVTVTGEVFNPTSLVFVSGKDVQYYLDQVGGPTMNADTDSILVIRSDGSVTSRRQNRGFLLRNFYQMEVFRGDTILVPKDISRFSWLATTKDLTEILFKIASTTGITITAFK